VSLEDQQLFNDAEALLSGNVSASNDPNQVQHDANEWLIKGAEVEASRQALGLSEEEAYELLARKATREDQMAHRRVEQKFRRGAAPAADWKQNAPRKETWADPFGEVQGIREIPNESVKADIQFGQDQTELQNFLGEGDRAEALDPDARPGDSDSIKIRNKDGSYEYVTVPKGKPTPEGLKNAFLRRDYGYPGMRETMVPPMAQSRAADEAVALATREREDARVTPEMRQAAAEDRAFTEKIREMRASVGDAGYIAGDAGVRNAARIPNLSRLGTAKKGIANQFTTNVSLDPNRMPLALPRSVENPAYVDARSGMPVGQLFGPDEVDPNQPGTAQMLNAPQVDNALDFVVGNQPSNHGGRVMGGTTNVDITAATNLFAERLGSQGVNRPGNVRSMDELQRAVDEVIGKGGDFFVKDAESGGQLRIDPGVDAVLTKMRYSGPEKQQLAAAMLQLEMAKRSGVNQEYKDAYFSRGDVSRPFNQPVNFNARDVFYQGEEVARMGAGRKIQGESGKTALAGLSPSEVQAQRPFIGALAEEGEAPIKRQVFKGRTPAETEANLRAQAKKNKKPVDIGKVRQYRKENVDARARNEAAIEDAWVSRHMQLEGIGSDGGAYEDNQFIQGQRNKAGVENAVSNTIGQAVRKRMQDQQALIDSQSSEIMSAGGRYQPQTQPDSSSFRAGQGTGFLGRGRRGRGKIRYQQYNTDGGYIGDVWR